MSRPNGSTELLPARAIPAPPPPAIKRPSLGEMQTMAESVAKSRLWPGIESPQAALALMLLCDSEGLHPMQAMRRYHIIEGRPSMRADAMQAEFQRRGGTIRWHQYDAVAAEATFYHPTHAPDGVRLRITLKEMMDSGVAKGKDGYPKKNWKQSPGSMLRARVVSQGIRLVDPSVVVGIYSPEEAEDFGDQAETIPPDHGSGHGRGQYASPEDCARYEAWARALVDGANGRWLDRWTNRDGQVAEGIGDLCRTADLGLHLLRWAVRTDRLDGSIDPATAKLRQVAPYLAIVMDREPEALAAEADFYLAERARMAEQAWHEAHPPEPGADDDDGPHSWPSYAMRRLDRANTQWVDEHPDAGPLVDNPIRFTQGVASEAITRGFLDAPEKQTLAWSREALRRLWDQPGGPEQIEEAADAYLRGKVAEARSLIDDGDAVLVDDEGNPISGPDHES